MKIGIIGLGLMGGSLGLALQKYHSSIQILGHDINENHLKYAKENKIIDHVLENENIKDLDIIFIAVPVKATIQVIKNILPYIDKENTIITDMGSTKSYIQKHINENYSDLKFIGGHPMAGKETSGPGEANSDLFKNKTYVLLKSNDKITNKIKKVLLPTGCNIKIFKAQEHDKMVALTSHLPHFNAAVIINQLITASNKNIKIEDLVGNGFLDMTRIAGSNPQMWLDIFLTNKQNIIEQIDLFINNINKFKHIIEKEKKEDIKNYMLKAQKYRTKLERENNNENHHKKT